MIEIKIDYEGQLRCSATHGPSGDVLATDAPVDNNGRGEAFSPTDLLAASLGSCMATVMGIVAQQKEVSLEGMKLSVTKHMSDDTPRRISRLDVVIHMPVEEGHPERKALEGAALGCPVHHSIHPAIEVLLSWHWA